MYYNTTNQSGQVLTDFRQAAKTQDDKILAWFRTWHATAFTPFDLQKALRMESTPITSIRRSITNLTDSGFLVKLDTKAPGLYNRPNHQWKLAK